jgi:hypothetical protein
MSSVCNGAFLLIKGKTIFAKGLEIVKPFLYIYIIPKESKSETHYKLSDFMKIHSRAYKTDSPYSIEIVDGKCLLKGSKVPYIEVLYDPETMTGKITNWDAIRTRSSSIPYSKFRAALNKAIAFAKHNIIV